VFLCIFVTSLLTVSKQDVLFLHRGMTNLYFGDDRYFSYEHFYVIYCKFWELDSDHDFLIDKDDLLRYGNHALTYRIVERIFSQVGVLLLPSTSLFLVIVYLPLLQDLRFFVFGRKLAFLLILYIPCCC
jgi:hypothetical protein